MQQHGDMKRSLDQLASIINSGDLEKIIRLAKEVKGYYKLSLEL